MENVSVEKSSIDVRCPVCGSSHIENMQPITGIRNSWRCPHCAWYGDYIETIDDKILE